MQEEATKLPTYKAKEKEALAWLFTALMKIELEPLTLSLTHTNDDFLRRFTQLAKLGRVRLKDLNTRKWELTNPKEIAFLLTEMKSHIHTQRERNIADLLIAQCTKPNIKTEDKLKPLIRKHNVYFYIEVR